MIVHKRATELKWAVTSLLYHICCCKLPITTHHALLLQMLKSHCVICIINWLVSWGVRLISPSPFHSHHGASRPAKTHWRAVTVACVPASPVAGGPMSRLRQGSARERPERYCWDKRTYLMCSWELAKHLAPLLSLKTIHLSPFVSVAPRC